MNSIRFPFIFALLILLASCSHYEKKDNLRTLASDQTCYDLFSELTGTNAVKINLLNKTAENSAIE